MQKLNLLKTREQFRNPPGFLLERESSKISKLLSPFHKFSLCTVGIDINSRNLIFLHRIYIGNPSVQRIPVVIRSLRCFLEIRCRPFVFCNEGFSSLGEGYRASRIGARKRRGISASFLFCSLIHSS